MEGLNKHDIGDTNKFIRLRTYLLQNTYQLTSYCTNVQACPFLAYGTIYFNV